MATSSSLSANLPTLFWRQPDFPEPARRLQIKIPRSSASDRPSSLDVTLGFRRCMLPALLARSFVTELVHHPARLRFKANAYSPRTATRCMSGTKRMAPTTIGTHDGSFHCDEALGCFLLQQTSAYSGGEIVRSRDPEVLATCDVVIDVGATYDLAKNKFDHHQKGFTEVFGFGFTTKLSSAGLVYKHFGREIVANVLGWKQGDERVEKIFLKMYKTFIEAVDANDNGVNQYDTDAPQKYEVNTSLPSRVGKLNPAWNEPFTPESQLTQFRMAMEMTGAEFVDALKYYGESWLLARGHVVQALDEGTAARSFPKSATHCFISQLVTVAHTSRYTRLTLSGLNFSYSENDPPFRRDPEAARVLPVEGTPVRARGGARHGPASQVRAVRGHRRGVAHPGHPANAELV